MFQANSALWFPSKMCSIFGWSWFWLFDFPTFLTYPSKLSLCIKGAGKRGRNANNRRLFSRTTEKEKSWLLLLKGSCVWTILSQFLRMTDFVWFSFRQSEHWQNEILGMSQLLVARHWKWYSESLQKLQKKCVHETLSPFKTDPMANVMRNSGRNLCWLLWLFMNKYWSVVIGLKHTSQSLLMSKSPSLQYGKFSVLRACHSRW